MRFLILAFRGSITWYTSKASLFSIHILARLELKWPSVYEEPKLVIIVPADSLAYEDAMRLPDMVLASQIHFMHIFFGDVLVSNNTQSDNILWNDLRSRYVFGHFWNQIAMEIWVNVGVNNGSGKYCPYGCSNLGSWINEKRLTACSMPNYFLNQWCLLSIGPLGRNLNEISTKIWGSSFKKMR